MGSFDYQDSPAEQLMAPGNQRVMLALLQKILNDAASFWSRQRVRLRPGFREKVLDAKEFVDVRRLFFSREEIGEVDRQAFTMHDACVNTRSEVWRDLRGRTRHEAMLVRDRLRAGEIAVRVLVEYRNATAHHSSAEPACLAGTLLLLIDNAGDLPEADREAAMDLRKGAVQALRDSLKAYQSGDDEGENETTVASGETQTDSPREPLTAPEPVSNEVRRVVQDTVMRGVVAGFRVAREEKESDSAPETRDLLGELALQVEDVLSRQGSLAERLSEAVDAVERAAKAGTTAAASTSGSTDPQDLETVRDVQDLVGELRRLVARGLDESDLRYLTSLVKQQRNEGLALMDIEKLREALSSLEQAITEGRDVRAVQEAASRGAKEALAEGKGDRRGGEEIAGALESVPAELRAVKAAVQEVQKGVVGFVDADRLSADELRAAATAAVQAALGDAGSRPRHTANGSNGGAGNGETRLMREEWERVRVVVDDLVARVSLLLEGLRDAAQPKVEAGEPAVAGGYVAYAEDDSLEPAQSTEEATELLTPQQAENRLISLRNRIKYEMDIEWFECALQKKFIDQMIRERLRGRNAWLNAGGTIGSWFSDRRNRDRSELMAKQLDRYGDEVFKIMKSIMYDDEAAGENVDEVDDDIPF